VVGMESCQAAPERGEHFRLVGEASEGTVGCGQGRAGAVHSLQQGIEAV